MPPWRWPEGCLPKPVNSHLSLTLKWNNTPPAYEHVPRFADSFHAGSRGSADLLQSTRLESTHGGGALYHSRSDFSCAGAALLGDHSAGAGAGALHDAVEVLTSRDKPAQG